MATSPDWIDADALSGRPVTGLEWQWNPFALLPASAGIICVWLALLPGARQQATSEGRSLVLLGLASAYWCGSEALYLCATAPVTKLWLAKLQYLGIVTVPLTWLVFTVRYTGNERLLGKRGLVALALIPATTLVLVIANDHFRVVWSDIAYVQESGASRFVYRHGWWFWVHVAWGYAVMLAILGTLLAARRRVGAAHRSNLTAMTLATLAPWCSNLAYLKWRDVIAYDPTPTTFAVAAGIVGLAASRTRLLDVRPLVRAGLMDRLRDAVLIVDANARLIDLNAAAQRLLDRRASELLGCEIHECAPQIAEVAAEGGGQVILNEPPVHLELTTHDLAAPSGAPAATVILARDITDRRRAEQAAAQAERLALVGSLAAAIGHEVRNPLFALTASVDALEQGVACGNLPDREALLHFLEVQRTQATRLVRLLNGMVLYSGDEARSTLTDLESVLREAVGRFEARAAERGVSFEHVWLGGGFWVRSDPRRLLAALTHVIENAVDFAPPNSEIDIALRAEAASATIEVRDRGPGFAPEELADVFKPFHTSRARHSGFGLALVERVFLDHGGEAQAENAAGGGARITLVLPGERDRPGAPLPASLGRSRRGQRGGSAPGLETSADCERGSLAMVALTR